MKFARSPLFDRSEKRIVFRKVVAPRLPLRRRPCEIHAHPAEADGADHFEFARLRLGEVDVHAEPVERARRGQRRVNLRAGRERKGEEEQQRAHGEKREQ